MLEHHVSTATDSAGFMHAAFADADEQAAALTGWHQSYLQLVAGGFSGSMRRLDLGGAKLFIEELKTSVYQTGVLEAGVLAMGVSLRSGAPGLFCGRRCDQDSLHVFSGRSGFEFRSANNHVMLGFELSPQLTASLTQAAQDEQLLGEEAGVYACAPEALNSLRQLLLNIVETAQSRPALVEQASVRSAMVDCLVDKAAALSQVSFSGQASPQTHWRLVQEARELIAARIQQPPSVVELCATLRVSRRTLQSAFQQILGLGPLSYLRAARFNAARQLLKTSATVTDAATQLGFWHFGHFSSGYCAMFGELPSQTRRRHLGTAPSDGKPPFNQP